MSPPKFGESHQEYFLKHGLDFWGPPKNVWYPPKKVWYVGSSKLLLKSSPHLTDDLKPTGCFERATYRFCRFPTWWICQGALIHRRLALSSDRNGKPSGKCSSLNGKVGDNTVTPVNYIYPTNSGTLYHWKHHCGPLSHVIPRNVNAMKSARVLSIWFMSCTVQHWYSEKGVSGIRIVVKLKVYAIYDIYDIRP